MAQGDFAGVGAGDFDSVAFPLSDWPLERSPPCLVPPAPPGFRIVFVPPVKLGPVELGLDNDGVAGFDSSGGFSSFFTSGFGGSSGGGEGSAGLTVDLVPSIHSTVSGAQFSSSSSSMSAHFDSFVSSSACNLVAMWIPNCCLSSSSVNCLTGGGGVGLFLFQTILGSGPVLAPFSFERLERPIALPTPLPDFATSRGFAVGCVEIEA